MVACFSLKARAFSRILILLSSFVLVNVYMSTAAANSSVARDAELNFSQRLLRINHNLRGQGETKVDYFVHFKGINLYVLMGMLTRESIFVCLKPGSLRCSRRYNSVQTVQSGMTHRFAYPRLSRDQLLEYNVLKTLDDFEMETTSVIESVDSEYLYLSVGVTKKYSQDGPVIDQKNFSMRIKLDDRYENIRLDFTDELSLGGDIKTHTEVGQSHIRQMAEATIRMLVPYIKDNGSAAKKVATGFFYRSKNLIMTNYHPFKYNKKCLDLSVRCRVEFLHTDRSGSVREFSQEVEVIDYNTSHDYAIFKILTPREIPALILPIENDYVGQRLVSIGYPANARGAIRYSFGEFKGFNFNNARFVSSLHSRGGFSGSPIIDYDRGTIVGLMREFYLPGDLNDARISGASQGPANFPLLHYLETTTGIRRLPEVQLALAR